MAKTSRFRTHMYILSFYENKHGQVGNSIGNNNCPEFPPSYGMGVSIHEFFRLQKKAVNC
ncbi:hypothetical protein DERP_005002 [Dermatophagoides pteronyssinus]|uniref:Uncharacterized protein n=1 Tax=Dermatophagoides pteronyssinus TaxID=6956 RepID=A0ABQ8JT24_DERPT|nr:hypothetical protein DERP_005002 [Dermatophagoides pteronyssinus]